MAKNSTSTDNVRNFIQKHPVKKYGMLALALMVIGSISYIGAQNKQGSYAATGGTLTLAPATGSYASGSNFTVAVRVNSGTNPINAVQASLNYNASQVQFVSIAESPTFPTVAATSTTTPGVIRVARGTAASTTITGDQAVVSVTFKMLATSGAAPITIDSAFSNIALAADGTNMLSTVSGGSYTVPAAAAATMALSPATGSFVQNSTVSVVVRATSATAKMLTAQAVLNYPAAQLQYVSTTEGIGFPTAQRTNTATPGVVDIIRSIPGGNIGLTGTHDVVTVNFKVIGTTGTAAINFAATSGIFDDSGSGASVLGGTSGASYSVTAAAPAVTSVSPTTGLTNGGTAVTLTGSNFVSGATVTIGGVAATNVVFVSPTSITAVTPARAAGAASVVVTNPSGLTTTLANAFTYQNPAPVVSSVSPTSGLVAGGTTVTVTGSNFLTGAQVRVGTTAVATTFVSATSLRFVTPAVATTGAQQISVVNPDQKTSGTVSFTYGSASGDANNDGRVNAIDLSMVISNDGTNYPPADFNLDNTVGAADLAILLSRWTW